MIESSSAAACPAEFFPAQCSHGAGGKFIAAAQDFLVAYVVRDFIEAVQEEDSEFGSFFRREAGGCVADFADR